MNQSIDMSGMTAEEAVQVMKVLGKISQIKTEAEKRKSQALINELSSVGGKQKLTKATAPKKPGRPKKHWKHKKRVHRTYMREYMNRKYKALIAPRRKQLAAEGSWYEYYLMEWKKRGFKVEVTKEEWDQHVQPRIGDRVPTLFRLNTAKPVALYNILVKDSGTKETIFDGTDWMLNQLGVLTD